MTPQEQIAVMQAYADGKPVEWKLKDSLIDWEPHDLPSWNWSIYTYRIAATKPSIDWSHVADEYRWLAVDEDGRASLFSVEPCHDFDDHEWAIDQRGRFIDASALTSFRPGTCDWRDSLVERPK